MSFLKKLFGGKKPEINSYADFWAWFQAHEKTFYRAVKNEDNIDGNFFSLLSPALDALGHNFYFVTGMFNPSTVELIITAEGHVNTFVFVEELIAAAPKIEGWRFTAHKPVLDIADANIHMSGYIFNKDSLQFYPVEFSDYPDQIELVVVHPELTEDNKETIGSGVHIFLDNYLGEVNFATMVDHVHVQGPGEDHPDLIPIIKLKDYLLWREKEFIEKYEGLRHQTEDDTYNSMEATGEDGTPVIGVMNADLLRWDRKASHPWLLQVDMAYEKDERSGMPDEATYALLDEAEEALNASLKDFEGYLNIGRITTNGVRTVYFACREFRKPSLVSYAVGQEYADRIGFE
jgi:hypothetical protein